MSQAHAAEVASRHGRWRAAVLPALGASLARLEVERDGRCWSLLRRARADADDALQTACFPMAPFCGRIRDGRFRFRGREIALPPMPPARTPPHGVVWRAPWRVTARADAQLALECEHPGGDWPWPFAAMLSYALGDDGLDITLAVRNTGPEPMPCGLGLHPYLDCDADTRLNAQLETKLLMDAEVLPLGDAPIRDHERLQRRAICRLGLDDSFEGWDGVATIAHGGGHPGVRLHAPAATRLHVYAPRDEDYVCIEALSHRIDACNRDEASFPALGLAVLEPGERTSLRLGIGTP